MGSESHIGRDGEDRGDTAVGTSAPWSINDTLMGSPYDGTRRGCAGDSGGTCKRAIYGHQHIPVTLPLRIRSYRAMCWPLASYPWLLHSIVRGSEVVGSAFSRSDQIGLDDLLPFNLVPIVPLLAVISSCHVRLNLLLGSD